MRGVPWYTTTLQLIVILLMLVHKCSAIVYMQSQCGHTVQSPGDVIFSQTSLYSQPTAKCTLTLLAPTRQQKIRIKFMDFDIGSDEPCESSYLEVKGVDTSHRPQGVRVLCGRQPPEDMTSLEAWLKLNFKTDGTQNGRGFRMVFTAIYQDTLCTDPEMFHCSNGVCISSRLTCDSVDHCGDGSDEVRTEDGTCGDEKRGGNISTSDVDLATVIFSFLGLLFTALVLGMILWQCSVYVRQKCCRSITFLGKYLDRGRNDSMVEPRTDQKTSDSEVSVCSKTHRQIAEETDREWEQKAEEPSDSSANETVRENLGKFSVNKVESDNKNGGNCKGQGTSEGAELNQNEGETTEHASKRVSIGRFSVQRIKVSEVEAKSGLSVPMPTIVITDPTQRISRSKVGFVLNPGRDESDRRPSKVKFIFPDENSDPGSPPPTPTRQCESILKKNPRYPDLQSYESKMTLSLKSGDSSSDDGDFSEDMLDESDDASSNDQDNDTDVENLDSENTIDS